MPTSPVVNVERKVYQQPADDCNIPLVIKKNLRRERGDMLQMSSCGYDLSRFPFPVAYSKIQDFLTYVEMRSPGVQIQLMTGSQIQ